MYIYVYMYVYICIYANNLNDPCHYFVIGPSSLFCMDVCDHIINVFPVHSLNKRFLILILILILNLKAYPSWNMSDGIWYVTRLPYTVFNHCWYRTSVYLIRPGEKGFVIVQYISGEFYTDYHSYCGCLSFHLDGSFCWSFFSIS